MDFRSGLFSFWFPRTDASSALSLFDCIRPDHAWLGRTQCKVTAGGDVPNGAAGKVSICCHPSLLYVPSLAVGHFYGDGLWKTTTPARGVCNGRQGEVETDEGDSDETRGPDERCCGNQNIWRQSDYGRG